MKKVFPASVSHTYIHIYQVGRFFSSTQVDKTEANWFISLMIRKYSKRSPKVNQVTWPSFPVSHHFCARSTIYSVKSMTLFSTGVAPGFAGVVANAVFYGGNPGV